jgi:hypothetical protein
MFVAMNDRGQTRHPVRVEHCREIFRRFLEGLPPGSPIAIESVGNWYWMIEEMERAGHEPRLAHAGKAKLMMGQINKDVAEVSDIFGVTGRKLLQTRLEELPACTRRSMETQLELLDQLEEHIGRCEEQIRAVVEVTPEMKLLMTIPGVGQILAVVMAWEIGEISRFPGPDHLASYAGTVPRVKSSGGRRSFGRVRPDVNRYLKWALIEAVNVIQLNQGRWPDRHVVRLYQRVRERAGHPKAIVAVSRHLAEATYGILKRKEPYYEPQKPISSTQEKARDSHES